MFFFLWNIAAFHLLYNKKKLACCCCNYINLINKIYYRKYVLLEIKSIYDLMKLKKNLKKKRFFFQKKYF